MQCHLNGVHISKIPKFLVESSSETTHAVKLVKPSMPPVTNSASVQWCNQFFWCGFPKCSRIWGWRHSNDLLNCWRTSMGSVRKQSVEPIVLAKRWGITPEKAQKAIQATAKRGIRTMLHPSLLRRFRMNDRNLHYHCLAHPIFSDMMFASTVFRRGNRCAHYMPQTLDGLKLSQWYPEVKHMRPCCCCSLGMVSHKPVYATMPKPEAQRCCMSSETVRAVHYLVKCSRERDKGA